MQRSELMYGFVLRQHGEEISPLGRGDGYPGWRRFRLGVALDIEEVEEGIGRMRIMSAEGLQTELAMHEYDRITGLEEVFCRRRASGSCIDLEPETDRSNGFDLHQH